MFKRGLWQWACFPGTDSVISRRYSPCCLLGGGMSLGHSADVESIGYTGN